MAGHSSPVAARMKSELEQSGFTDVKVMPESFLVRAKDRDGHPVMMIVNPDSLTAVTALGNGGNTGSRSSANGSTGNAMGSSGASSSGRGSSGSMGSSHSMGSSGSTSTPSATEGGPNTSAAQTR
jgi:hypothetical protein